MNTAVRIRVVAEIRAHLARCDAHVAPGAPMAVVCQDAEEAEQVALDLTREEQAQVRISARCAPTVPRIAPCEVCGGALADRLCARCHGPACQACDLCGGCGQFVCQACDRGFAGTFAFPGDETPHPHSEGL